MCGLCDLKVEEINNKLELKQLLEKMDIPDARRSDIPWIKRNLPINNSEHPDFAKTWELLGMKSLAVLHDNCELDCVKCYPINNIGSSI